MAINDSKLFNYQRVNLRKGGCFPLHLIPYPYSVLYLPRMSSFYCGWTNPAPVGNSLEVWIIKHANYIYRSYSILKNITDWSSVCSSTVTSLWPKGSGEAKQHHKGNKPWLFKALGFPIHCAGHREGDPCAGRFWGDQVSKDSGLWNRWDIQDGDPKSL